MAIGGMEICYVVLVLLSFNIFANAANNETEVDHLLQLKASLSDPFRFLFNWNPSVNICSWNGITCRDNATRVTKISMPGRNLTGKISESVFQLPSVESIDLSDNEISGVMPMNTFSCLSLRYLNISENNFTGPIPLGSNPFLQSLDFSNNMFSGEIPEDIQRFSALKVLSLGGNELHGKIPRSLSKLGNLEYLTLAGNLLAGEIPRELGAMKTLKWIYFGYNNLSGEIPNELGNIWSLSHLDLVYNNLTGVIPSSLGNLSQLQYLFLYQNKLSGPIPSSIANLKKLISLDLSGNSLVGEIPELISQLKNLEILHLFSNNFTGIIPTSLASLPRLQVLQLWSNQLSGEIPKDLGKQNNLTVLDLSTNKLSGKLPEGICSSNSLSRLILFSNFLDGEILKILSKCKSLHRVRIQNNHFSGELPQELTTLPLIYYLDISGNMFSGRIHHSWNMLELQMLNLARNGFTGNLPDKFGSKKLENLDFSENEFSGNISLKFKELSELVKLKLSKNKLSGFIPDLSSCTKLVCLDLSHNRLDGPIPVELTTMPVLGELDLSDNCLYGEIPRNAGEFESLTQVNISHNMFQGKLPLTGAFVAINASAVAGNKLCGGDIVTGLPLCKTGTASPIVRVLLPCSIVVFVLILFSFFGLIFIRRPKKTYRDEEEQDSFWALRFFDAKASRTINVDDIISSMKDDNVISRGKNGTFYKGKSVGKGKLFVAKEVTGNPNFSQEVLEDLGNIRHPNVVKLIGTCNSEKVTVLVYELVDGNNLTDVLCKLNWETRSRITIGLAKALRCIHSHGKLVENLSMDEVIVDEKGEARLRLPLPRSVVTHGSKGFLDSIHVAPETKERKETTEKSDVYAFGVLLIEILTGTDPMDYETGSVNHNIVDWAHYSYSECLLDSWIDPVLKGSKSNHLNEIVETMSIAIQCTHTDPSARPCSNDVVRSLASVLQSRSCL